MRRYNFNSNVQLVPVRSKGTPCLRTLNQFALTSYLEYILVHSLDHSDSSCLPRSTSLSAISRATGFHPSWSSLCHLGIRSGTNLRQRRLVPIFYGNLRPAGVQTIWLLWYVLCYNQLLYCTLRNKTHEQKKLPLVLYRSILYIGIAQTDGRQGSNHPKKNTTMVEPVAGLAAWLLCFLPPRPGSLCGRG